MLDSFILLLLGILLQALPFLLAGALLSGMMEAFIPSSTISKLMPKGLFPALMIGAFAGFFLPLCECSSVFVVRRLLQKGVSPPACLTLMLAAPIVNPIVLASTYVAYSWYPTMVALRVSMGLIVAILTALLINFLVGRQVLRTEPPRTLQLQEIFSLNPLEEFSLGKRLKWGIFHGMYDFLALFPFFLLGATFTALFKTVAPSEIFLFLQEKEFLSIPLSFILAFFLALCSDADAFIASALNGIFTIPSQLAFLVFGPMMDIKLFLIYGRFFRKKVLLSLLLVPMGLILVLIYILMRYL